MAATHVDAEACIVYWTNALL